MTTLTVTPRVTSFAPQFLVDDLARSIAYYAKLGFIFGEPWDGFYAIGQLDGLELHLKEAPKHEAERQHRREQQHVDAAAGVDGIEAFYARCAAKSERIIRPPTATSSALAVVRLRCERLKEREILRTRRSRRS